MRNHHGVTVVAILCDKNNNIKRTHEIQPNLILDSGLNRLATTAIAQCMARCAIGTGTTPTNRGTQGIFVQKTGNTVTTSEAFFENDDALFHRVLQLSDDTVCRILSVDSATQVVVDNGTSTLVNGAAIIWNVEQTTLTTQLSVSETVNTSKSTFNGTVATVINLNGVNTLNIDRFRTFQFDFEDESHTVTEAGWTWDEVALTPTLFGRIVFSEPIEITPHDRLLIKVIFNQKLAIPTYVGNDPYFSANATWDASPIVSGFSGISYIDSGGVIRTNTDGDYLAMLEPVKNRIYHTFLDLDSTVLNQVTLTSASYVANSYSRTWSPYAISADFPAAISQTGFRINSTTTAHALSLNYAVPQVKPDQSTITTTFGVSWDRKLPTFPS